MTGFASHDVLWDERGLRLRPTRFRTTDRARGEPVSIPQPMTSGAVPASESSPTELVLTLDCADARTSLASTRIRLTTGPSPTSITGRRP